MQNNIGFKSGDCVIVIINGSDLNGEVGYITSYNSLFKDYTIKMNNQTLPYKLYYFTDRELELVLEEIIP